MTIAFLPIRDNITPLSKGFAYLAVVVAAAATGSLGPGIAASVLGFLSFNYFFLPPYGQWTIARPEYVAVLFAFLALSVIISELLARAAERARSAEAREAELRTIQELSRELTTRVPGEDTIEVALLTVKNAFGYSAAALFVEQTEDVRGLVQQVTVGGAPGSVSATWDPRSPEQPPERLPLSVGGRMLGLVVLKGDRPPLTPAKAASSARSAINSPWCSSAIGSCAPRRRPRSIGRPRACAARCSPRCRMTSAARSPRSRHRSRICSTTCRGPQRSTGARPSRRSTPRPTG